MTKKLYFAKNGFIFGDKETGNKHQIVCFDDYDVAEKWVNEKESETCNKSLISITTAHKILGKQFYNKMENIYIFGNKADYNWLMESKRKYGEGKVEKMD